MKKSLKFFMGILVLCTFLGCETLVGVTRDIENTARNIGNILTSGRELGDVVK